MTLIHSVPWFHILNAGITILSNLREILLGPAHGFGALIHCDAGYRNSIANTWAGPVLSLFQNVSFCYFCICSWCVNIWHWGSFLSCPVVEHIVYIVSTFVLYPWCECHLKKSHASPGRQVISHGGG